MIAAVSTGRGVGLDSHVSGIANLLAVPFGAMFTLTGNLCGMLVCLGSRTMSTDIFDASQLATKGSQ